MNIRQLQYFCAVVRFGSFSRAAQDQGVSVQAVSKAIVELEGEFGQRLFVRGSKGVSATPFGRAVSLRAQHAIDAFRAVEEVAATGGEGLAAEDNVLRTMLVTPPFPHKERVCGSFAKMFSARMGIDVDLQVGAGCDALARLLDGSEHVFGNGVDWARCVDKLDPLRLGDGDCAEPLGNAGLVRLPLCLDAIGCAGTGALGG